MTLADAFSSATTLIDKIYLPAFLLCWLSLLGIWLTHWDYLEKFRKQDAVGSQYRSCFRWHHAFTSADKRRFEEWLEQNEPTAFRILVSARQVLLWIAMILFLWPLVSPTYYENAKDKVHAHPQTSRSSQ